VLPIPSLNKPLSIETLSRVVAEIQRGQADTELAHMTWLALEVFAYECRCHLHYRWPSLLLQAELEQCYPEEDSDEARYHMHRYILAVRTTPSPPVTTTSAAAFRPPTVRRSTQKPATCENSSSTLAAEYEETP
jgi:hypothetical protein